MSDFSVTNQNSPEISPIEPCPSLKKGLFTQLFHSIIQQEKTAKGMLITLANPQKQQPVRARKEITSQSETVRKLARIDDRKSVNIRNMNRLTIVDPRGFGAVSDAEVISLRALTAIGLISSSLVAETGPVPGEFSKTNDNLDDLKPITPVTKPTWATPLLLKTQLSIIDNILLTDTPITAQEKQTLVDWSKEQAENGEIELLGKMTYFLEYQPQVLLKWLEKPLELAEMVNKYFDTNFKKKIRRLRSEAQDFTLFKQQYGDLYYENQLPIALARFVIGPHGTINRCLLPYLIKFCNNNATVHEVEVKSVAAGPRKLAMCEELMTPALLTTNKVQASTGRSPADLPQLHEQLHNNQQMSFVLKTLQKRDSFYQKLLQIKAPANPLSPGALTIRTTLGIPAYQSLTNAHARCTVLSALLSHTHQEKDGSCFSTALLNSILSSYPEKACDDFSNLIIHQGILRQVEGRLSLFPFLLRTNNLILKPNITLDHQGVIQGKRALYIWEHPAFIQAANALKVHHCRQVYESVLKKLFAKKKARSQTVSSEKILKLLVKKAAKKNREASEEIAAFAFEAKLSHPLVLAAKISLASMAEAGSDGLVKSAILSAIERSFIIKSQECMDQPLLLKKICQKLLNQIHLHYDPSLLSKNQQGKIGAGGFVLYDKEGGNPAYWLPIYDAKSFQNWLSRCVRLSLKKDDLYQQLVPALTALIQKETFLKTVLTEYYPENKQDNEQKAGDSIHRYTPWATHCGNSLTAVLETWLGAKPKEAVIQGKDGESLLASLVDYLKGMGAQEKQRFTKYPHQIIPIRIPSLHAFGLLPGHPSLQCIRDLSAEEIIAARFQSDVLVCQLSLKGCEEILFFIARHFIEPAKRAKFKATIRTQVQQLPPPKIRELILQTIPQFQITHPKKLACIAHQLDQLIMKLLPVQNRQTLIDNALIFANTNWRSGSHEKFLCFILSPATAKIELWTIRDDYTALTPLNQTEWLEEAWHIYNL